MEQLLTLIVGIVAPYLIQLVRRLCGSAAFKGNLVPQAITLGVSVVLGASIGLATNELKWSSDLMADITVIFVVATVAYKQFQGHFDRMLPSNSKWSTEE